jgi:hypothetical protein
MRKQSYLTFSVSPSFITSLVTVHYDFYNS